MNDTARQILQREIKKAEESLALSEQQEATYAEMVTLERDLIERDRKRIELIKEALA